MPGVICSQKYFCTRAWITLHSTAPAEIRASLHKQAPNKRIFLCAGLDFWIAAWLLAYNPDLRQKKGMEINSIPFLGIINQ